MLVGSLVCNNLQLTRKIEVMILINASRTIHYMAIRNERTMCVRACGVGSALLSVSRGMCAVHWILCSTG